MQDLPEKSKIYGVDFSGSKKAGEKIWICESTSTDNGLQINNCYSLKEKYGKIYLDESLEKLADLIASNYDAVFGLDFPFGLPRNLVEEQNWKDFVSLFAENHLNPESFRQNCFEKTKGKGLYRLTDKETKVPFFVFHMWLHKQTYYGITQILYPLVKNNSVSIFPMQEPDNKKPWVIEICPASTLKYEKIDSTGFKNGSKEAEDRRKAILNELVKIELIKGKKLLSEISDSARKSAIKDKKGDALDSIIAAMATYRAMKSNLIKRDYNLLHKLEGYIYV